MRKPRQIFSETGSISIAGAATDTERISAQYGRSHDDMTATSTARIGAAGQPALA